MSFAAGSMLVAVPSPLEGEGDSAWPRNSLGEGYRAAEIYPSPNSLRCTAAAALSLKVRGLCNCRFA